MSTKGDEMVERAASRLDDLSEQASSGDGVKAKLADPLAEDADFLRKMKPSLVKERIKGNEPDEPSGGAPPRPKPKAKRRGSGGGPNPFLVIVLAFAVGYALAKTLDWRGHAHPRD
jgi:hypothetical protein